MNKFFLAALAAVMAVVLAGCFPNIKPKIDRFDGRTELIEVRSVGIQMNIWKPDKTKNLELVGEVAKEFKVQLIEDLRGRGINVSEKDSDMTLRIDFTYFPGDGKVAQSTAAVAYVEKGGSQIARLVAGELGWAASSRSGQISKVSSELADQVAKVVRGPPGT